MKNEPEDITAGARVLATWKRAAKTEWPETLRMVRAVVAEVDRVRRKSAQRARTYELPEGVATVWRVGNPAQRERSTDLHEVDEAGRSRYIGTMANDEYALWVAGARRELARQAMTTRGGS